MRLICERCATVKNINRNGQNVRLHGLFGVRTSVRQKTNRIDKRVHEYVCKMSQKRVAHAVLTTFEPFPHISFKFRSILDVRAV